MESREQRIATLATTLRSSGIATSDSQAKMMAEDMIGVEEHVQRDYEVEHTRAHDYLQTTKNLGASRPIVKQESKIDIKQESPRSDPSRQESWQEPSRRFEELYTSGNSTSGNSSSSKRETVLDHDTHNSALEAIKAQISQAQVVRQEPTFEPVRPESVHDESSVGDSIFHKDIEIVPAETLSKISSPVIEAVDVIEAPQAPVMSEVETTVRENIRIPIQEELKKESTEKPQLDAKRLMDLMEEDGKLEEHTREIKEKPKDVKPKEAYEENNIDLGSMFDFNKGTVRK
jgi:hypothetical protein